MSERVAATTALITSTVSFTVCFASWVVNAVLVTYLVGAGVYAFSEAQVGWLLAVPILTGALSRVPLGLMTDRYGGRIVFPVVMLAAALAMYLLSFADSYAQFILASLGFGLAGGAFAVGIGYVSIWFPKEKQGTALGIFGMGNAGAAVTTMLAPHLLKVVTDQGANIEGWRQMPRIYAALLVITAILFFLLSQHRVVPVREKMSLATQLAPLRNIKVWRFGLYYFLVFGAFVALAQWIVPYSVSVYQVSLVQAGLIAALFSLPSGLIRAIGGWMSDRFGARSVMYGVFLSSIIACLILSIPKMDIESPGKGVLAKAAGEVSQVSSESIVMNGKTYNLIPPPAQTPGELDTGTQILPQIVSWQEPVIAEGETVEKKELLARGVTNIYYPANFWLFAALVLVFGVATGIGKAAVYKFIPDHFPNAVGAVGGMVGLLGALGGFVLPPVWGYLLESTGLWTSTWMLLVVISVVCLVWMHVTVRRLISQQVPELAQLVEQRPGIALPHAVALTKTTTADTIEDVLREIPFLANLNDEELKELARIGQRYKVEADEVLFKEGDPGDVLYVILDGHVKIQRTVSGGRQMELATLKSGNFFGELALIDGKPRAADARTLTPSDFFLIDRRNFLNLVSKSPHMLADLLLGLSAKVRETAPA